MARWFRHPGLVYALTAAVASVACMLAVDANHPPHPDFIALILPLHVVVTVSIVVFVPLVAHWLTANPRLVLGVGAC